MTKRKGYNTAKHHGGGVGKADYVEHHKTIKSGKTGPKVNYQGEETEDSDQSRSYAFVFVIVILVLLFLIKKAYDK